MGLLAGSSPSGGCNPSYKPKQIYDKTQPNETMETMVVDAFHIIEDGIPLVKPGWSAGVVIHLLG